MTQLLNINLNGTLASNLINNFSANNSSLLVNLTGTYDTVSLGNGNDTVLIGAGNDILTLGSGLDNILINASTTVTSLDTINLGAGSDNVSATGDVNLIINAINTTQASINLQASTGFDTLTAGNGNYNINLGNNSGSITSGDGNNTIHIGNTNTNISMTLGDGQNTVSLGNGAIDVISVGNGNNNQITVGNDQFALVTAGNGNNDSVVMGTGQDFVTMGNGNNDYVNLGDGNNTVMMGSGYNNLVLLGNGSNYVDAGAGSDVVIAGNGGASGNMFIYEAQPHGVVSTLSYGNTGCYNCCGNTYETGGNSCFNNSQEFCNSNSSCCGINICAGNSCLSQDVNNLCSNSCGNAYANNFCGESSLNNCCESSIGFCGENIGSCFSNPIVNYSDYSYYSGGGNLNTLEINMTDAQYQSYLTLDASHFSNVIPTDYTFNSIPLIIHNMTNIVFNDINAAANTDTLHFISAPSGQFYQGSEGTNILDYSGIVPSTANIQNEVLHVNLVTGETSLTDTSNNLVGNVDTVLNFNNVIGASHDFANIISLSSLNSAVDGGQNQAVHDTALNGLVANTLISNNELDLSGLSGNINISSTGTGTHGNWTDIGSINLGANTTLNLDAAGLPALEQHNVNTLIINSSSAAAGATDTVTANDLSNWTELSKTVNGVDPNGVSHTYNVYTHGTQTLLIDTNIHIQHV